MNTIKLPSGVFRFDPAKQLGKAGGFGQVFLGVTANGTEVAIKRLNVSPTDAAHRELRIADELRGKPFQYVIEYIDSGEDASSNGYFVVMPKADRSLEAMIESNGPQAASLSAQILLHVVSGLIEVEQLVHRDLKPDNILFHDGKWKVADLGIAKFAEETTSARTLRGFLSPHYAAPEQWRLETATHATDVYALGCVAFALLTGQPPFVGNPSEEHLNSPVPQFVCSDSRLLTLVRMMLRKPPDGRPSLGRVREFLAEIVAKPYRDVSASSNDALASAAAEVAAKDQAREAMEAAQLSAQGKRQALGRAAIGFLSESCDRMWDKIRARAVNAKRNSRGGSEFQCTLGNGSLSINLSTFSYVEPGAFKHSGWDVVAMSQAVVTQRDPRYGWEASLWYVKLKGASDYRWYEASYWHWHSASVHHSCSNLQDADFAASSIMHTVNFAFGPVAIDDDIEDEFHERWIWLLATASTGGLRNPSTMPIREWPPRF